MSTNPVNNDNFIPNLSALTEKLNNLSAGSSTADKTAVRIAAEALNQNLYRDFTADEITAITSLSTSYNSKKIEGVFLRAFGKSETETQIRKIFESIAVQGRVKQTVKSKALYVLVKFEEDGQISVTTHEKEVTLSDLVGSAIGAIAVGSSGFGPGASKTNRVWGRVRYGSLNAYHTSSVTVLTGRLTALKGQVDSLEQGDKKNLSKIIQEAIDIHKELDGLNNTTNWRPADVDKSKACLDRIKKGLDELDKSCIQVLLKVMDESPKNYVGLCSAFFSLGFLETRIKTLCEVSVGLKDLIAAFHTEKTEEFSKLSTGLMLNQSWEEAGQGYRKNVEDDIGKYKYSSNQRQEDLLETPAVVFKAAVEALAIQRLENMEIRLTEADKNLLKALLETSIDQIIRTKSVFSAEDISMSVRDAISMASNELLIKKIQSVSEASVSSSNLVSKINSEPLDTTSFSQRELDDIIDILKIFSNPDQKTIKEETVYTRGVKVKGGLKKIEAFKLKFPQNMPDQALIDDLEAKCTEEQTRLSGQESTPKLTVLKNDRIASELTRRHEEIIDRFCGFISKENQAKEEASFLAKMKELSIVQNGPADVFSWATRDDHMGSPEWMQWEIWLTKQTIPDGLTLPGLKAELPSYVIELLGGMTLLGNSNVQKIAKLKEEFNSELSRDRTPFGLIRSRLARDVDRDVDIDSIKQELVGLEYTDVQAQNMIRGLSEIRAANQKEIEEVGSFLRLKFQISDVVPRDLQDWQIQKYIQVAGYKLAPQDLASITTLNLSSSVIEEAAKHATEGDFVWLPSIMRSYKKVANSEELRYEQLGKDLLALGGEFNSIEKMKDAATKKTKFRREIVEAGVLSQRIKTLENREVSPGKAASLRAEFNRSIIHAFSQISRLQLQHTDESWTQFSEAIGLEVLKGLVTDESCKYNANEIHEIYFKAKKMVVESKAKFDGLQTRLSAGEMISDEEVSNLTQSYFRCLKIFKVETDLIKLKMPVPENNPDGLASYNSIAELDAIAKLVGAAASVEVLYREQESSVVRYRELALLVDSRVTAGLTEVTEAKIDEIQAYEQTPYTTERIKGFRELGIAQKQAEYAVWDQERTRIDKIEFLKDYMELLTSHILIYLEPEVGDVTRKLAAAAEELRELSSPPEDLLDKVKKNLTMGIGQIVLEKLQETMGDVVIPREITEKEDRLILSMLSKTRNAAATESSIAAELSQMRSGAEGWRDLPQHASWIGWARGESQKLIRPLGEDAFNEISMEAGLTLLSESLGKKPETYNDILFERFKCSVLTASRAAATEETLKKVAPLVIELDSVFFGKKWVSWVQARCHSGSAKKQGAEEETWVAGGVRYFNAIKGFRTDKKGDLLRKEFIKEQIIPVYQKRGINLTEEEGNLLLNAMIGLQGTLTVDQVVYSTDRILSAQPDLKSVIFGEKWASWVHDKCASRSAPKGAQEAKWAAGGVECLEDIIKFRTDKEEGVIKAEFYAKALAAYPDMSKEVIEGFVQTIVLSRRQVALNSIKIKVQACCNGPDDDVLQGNIKSVARYFRALGSQGFTEDDAKQFLLEMKEYRKEAKRLAVIETKPQVMQTLQALIDADGNLNQASAEAVCPGLFESQLWQPCCMSMDQLRDDLTRDNSAGSWEAKAKGLTAEKLATLKTGLDRLVV